MKIGVMMTAYNAAPFIQQALESLLRQRSCLIGFDIVVVNDGSTDDTAAIVRSVGAPEIRVIDTPNQGVTRARNVALEHMADDLDLFTSLDADDLSPVGRFERDVRHFLHDPQLDLLYGYASLFRQIADDGIAPAPGARVQTVRGITLGSGLFRYPFVRRIGHFDTALEQAEDLDFLLRMFEAHPRVKFVDDVCLYVRRHDANMTRDISVVRRHLAHALLMFSRRRRTSPGFELPSDIFDLDALMKEPPL